MRKWIAFFAVFLLIPHFGFADTNEIYEDIRWEAALNDDKTCEQLGITLPTDLDMCKRFKAASADEQMNWKIIQRPVTLPSAVIANPWAPSSQQSFTGGPTIFATTTPATSSPAATSPAATAPETPTTTPVETPPPPVPEPTPPPTPVEETPAPEADDGAAAKALADLENKKVPEDPPAEEKNVDPSPEDAPQTPVPESQSNLQIASAAGADGAIEISTSTAGLTPVTDVFTLPHADPPAPEASEDTPAESPSFFGKIFGWFHWLF